MTKLREGEVELNVRVPAELRRAARRCALDNEITLQVLVCQALVARIAPADREASRPV
jgi:hypothetical protein